MCKARYSKNITPKVYLGDSRVALVKCTYSLPSAEARSSSSSHSLASRTHHMGALLAHAKLSIEGECHNDVMERNAGVGIEVQLASESDISYGVELFSQRG